MKQRLSSPVAVWLLLVGATLLSYLAQLEAMRGNARLVGSAILVIAFAKVWLIGMRFMELDDAVPMLRLCYTAWVVVMAGALVTLFWLA
ncbi:MAG: cytochrome C oxidase subunit IV family protein [Novosphingobium sp.]